MNEWQKMINHGKASESQIKKVIVKFSDVKNLNYPYKFAFQNDEWAILSWLFEDPNKVFFALEKLANKDLKTASVFIESIMNYGASPASKFTSPYHASGGPAWVVGRHINEMRVIISVYAQNIADQLNIPFSKNLRIGDLPFWQKKEEGKLLLARETKFNLKKLKPCS